MYALGVLLHQLLTLYEPSVTPFKLPAVRSLNATASEQLEYIINKAINLDPRDRYIDTGLFRDEMVDYYEEHFIPFTSPYGDKLPYVKKQNSPVPLQLMTRLRQINTGTKIAIGWIIIVMGFLYIEFWHYSYIPTSPGQIHPGVAVDMGSLITMLIFHAVFLLAPPLVYLLYPYICK